MRRLWEGWKRVTRKIGDFQARLILTIFFYVVLAPFALAIRWGADPLAMKPGGQRGWLPRKPGGSDVWEAAKRQF
jgi:hypothetical protein